MSEKHLGEGITPDPADQRLFVVDAQAFQDFEGLCDRPPVFKPRLASLLSEPTMFEEGDDA